MSRFAQDKGEMLIMNNKKQITIAACVLAVVLSAVVGIAQMLSKNSSPEPPGAADGETASVSSESYTDAASPDTETTVTEQGGGIITSDADSGENANPANPPVNDNTNGGGSAQTPSANSASPSASGGSTAQQPVGNSGSGGQSAHQHSFQTVIVKNAWTENIPEQGHEELVWFVGEQTFSAVDDSDVDEWLAACRTSATAPHLDNVWVVDVPAQTIEHPAETQQRCSCGAVR